MENVLFQISKLLTQCEVVPSCVAMAGDNTDGCMPSKMVSSQEEMETERASQPQQSDLSPTVGRHWFILPKATCHLSPGKLGRCRCESVTARHPATGVIPGESGGLSGSGGGGLGPALPQLWDLPQVSKAELMMRGDYPVS